MHATAAAAVAHQLLLNALISAAGATVHAAVWLQDGGMQGCWAS